MGKSSDSLCNVVSVGDAAQLGIDLESIQAATHRLRKQVKEGRLPGFLSCIMRDNQLVHYEAHGFADVDRKLPMSADALIRLYSQTKPILITGFLQLMERGLVKLEDPISLYIPAFSETLVGKMLRSPIRQILVRDLLAHTSGIGFGPGFGYDPENDYEKTYYDLVKCVDRGEVTSLEDWCNRLAKLPLRFMPGRDWGYGYSSDVLGRIVEVVSGRPLDEYLHTEVIKPLGMHDTFFEVPAEKASRLSALYRREPWDGSGSHPQLQVLDATGGPKPSVFATGSASKVIQGGGCVCSIAGGLISTLRDYTQFAQMLLNRGELNGQRLLQESSVRLLERDWLNDFSPVDKRRRPLWVWGSAGVGFSPLGQIGVEHPEATSRRDVGAKLNTVHWGGAGGSGYMLNWPHRLLVLTYTGCVYDTATQKTMWRAAFGALSRGGLPKPLASATESRCGRKRSTSEGTPTKTPKKAAKRPPSPTKTPVKSSKKQVSPRKTPVKTSKRQGSPAKTSLKSAKRRLETPTKSQVVASASRKERAAAKS
jgi:CubicO group peptidase (beta-lactamase class C family)